MKIEKQKNGRYRAKLRVGDKVVTITCDTRAEVLQKAAKLSAGHDMSQGTVADAVREYIAVKEAVLSPATIRNYKNYLKAHIEGSRFGSVKLTALTDAKVQAWISELSKKLKPSSVKKQYSLFLVSMRMYKKGYAANVSLPKRFKENRPVPSSDDVKRIADAFREAGDDAMLRAVMIAATASLRCGEVCALSADDVKDGYVSVTKDVVYTTGKEWLVKEPKTPASVRRVPLTDDVLALIPNAGPVVGLTPDVVSKRFSRTAARLGMDYSFHDLRHFFATMMAYNNVPMRITQALGGWDSPTTVLEIYTGIIDSEKKRHEEAVKGIFKEKFFS